MLRLGDAAIDLDRRVVESPRARAPLSPLEVRLLKFLVSRRGRTVSRDELLGNVWGYSARVVTRAVDNTVLRLRRKIEVDPAEPHWLCSARGGGYRLETEGGGETETTHHNLPAEFDAFVGRDEELRALGALLAGQSRMVTVVGVGGVGKTRLVLRFVREVLTTHPGGVWWCDLSAATDRDGIVASIGGALGIPVPDADPVARIGHGIDALGPCVIVLDNFEQVATHAASTVGRWLVGAPRALFVVTSRAVLGVPGEVVFEVGPLADPVALELFTLRCRAAGAEPQPDDRAATASVVPLLDGLPLAIELAAVRSRWMTPQELASGIGDRFRLLTKDPRSSDRRDSLRAALDWSWSLCSPAERSVLAQLAVFDGGFGVADAEAVVDLSALPDPPWVGDLLQSLVNQSWIRRRPWGRLDLLPTLAAYAQARLAESGGRDEAERRHGRHFAARGTEEAVESLSRTGSAERLAAWSRDLPNLLAASRRAAERGDAIEAASTARAVRGLTNADGPPAMAEQVLERALGSGTLPAGLEILTRLDLGLVKLELEADDEARPEIERALASARELGDRRILGQALLVAGREQRRRACSPVARLEEAIACARSAGDRVTEAAALRTLGDELYFGGRHRDAADLLHRACALCERAGDDLGLCYSFEVLGQVQIHLGRKDAARASFEAGRVAARAARSVRAEATCLSGLAKLERSCGRLAEARQACEEALRILHVLGDLRTGMINSAMLAGVAADEGNLTEAAHAFRAILARTAQMRLPYLAILSTFGLASVCIDRGDLVEAEELLREALDRTPPLTPAAESRMRLQLGRLHRVQGDLPRARADLEAAIALAPGDHGFTGLVKVQLAAVEREAGHPSLALARIGEALELLREVRDRRTEARAILEEAEIRLALGDPAAAHRALIVAEAAALEAGNPVGRAEVLCARVKVAREAGDPDVARSAWEEARALAAALGVGPRSPLGQRLAALDDPGGRPLT